MLVLVRVRVLGPVGVRVRGGGGGDDGLKLMLHRREPEGTCSRLGDYRHVKSFSNHLGAIYAFSSKSLCCVQFLAIRKVHVAVSEIII